MIFLLTKLITIMKAQLGTIEKPNKKYPSGIDNPAFASHPSKGWNAPSYGAVFSYVCCAWMLTISFAVVVVVLSFSIRTVVPALDCSSSFITGSWICQMVGGAALQIEHRIALVSQLMYPSFGADGSAAKSAAVSFQATSILPHWPKQVLFAPDTSTIHVSGPWLCVVRDGEGTISDRQLSFVRGVIFLAATFAVELAMGLVAVVGRNDLALSNQA